MCYFRFSYSVLYFLCVSYVLKLLVQSVQNRHFEVLDGWQNLVHVQKTILNCPKKISKREQMATKYIGSLLPKCEVQTIQAKE